MYKDPEGQNVFSSKTDTKVKGIDNSIENLNVIPGDDELRAKVCSLQSQVELLQAQLRKYEVQVRRSFIDLAVYICLYI